MDEALPSEFLEILRLSIKSSADLRDTLYASAELPSDHIRKIIAAILWHRKFILTYYIVLGLVVAISCAHGCSRKAIRGGRKRKTNEKDTPPVSETASSSSSTLQGTRTPLQKDDEDGDTETTALLAPKEASFQRRPRPFHRLRALLMHQPRPIRALTSSSNVLPSNSTSLLVLFLFAVNLFYLFYRTSLSIEWIFILADRAGLLFVVNLPVLYLLAAKTNQPLKTLTGWSYEGLNLFHRRLGEWMVAFAVVHMLGMLLVWYTILRPLGYDLVRYLTTKVVFLGIAAVLSYYIIYITSIGWFRHLYYETFLALHILFQVAALLFLFFHYPTARPFVLAAFGIWAADRLLWRMTLSSRKSIATLEVAPDGHTILVHCDIDLQQKLFGMRLGLHHGWLPGQHVFLTMPSMKFKYRFQTHPFTIASPAPPKDVALKSWPLQLVIRSIDGFSLDLLEYARHHQHCEVLLDGPYGGTEALEAAHRADRVCYVAGGSGIAVTHPLAWDTCVAGSMQSSALISSRTVYENGAKSVPSLLDCGSLIDQERYAHFWVRQDPLHGEWITAHPKAGAVGYGSLGSSYPNTSNLGRDKNGEDVANLITHTFDTRSPGPRGGRPDIGAEIWNWVISSPKTPDGPSSCTSPGTQGLVRSQPNTTSTTSNNASPTVLTPNNSSASHQRPRKDKICIIVSGPDGLVRDVRNISAQLVRGGWDLEVWVEKFGW